MFSLNNFISARGDIDDFMYFTSVLLTKWKHLISDIQYLKEHEILANNAKLKSSFKVYPIHFSCYKTVRISLSYGFFYVYRKNMTFIAFTEKDVNVEQPSSDPQGCLLQNCMHIINNQPPSSYGYAMFTKSPTRLMGKSDGTTAVPIHFRETAFNYPKDFPESVSVHSQFYDKCQRTSDEYLPMEMSVTLSNRPNRSSYFEQ